MRNPTVQTISENFSRCKITSRGGLIPRAPRGVLEFDAVEQQLQRLRREFDFRARLAGTVRPGERARLQAFGQNANAGAVKIENLDPVAAAVAEDEERAALGIFAELLLGGVPETVETHPQVAGRGGDEHLQLRVEAQHERAVLRC